MRIALIGMSGVGKTYWSNILQSQFKYHRIGCDDLIGQRLAEKLTAAGVGSDLNSLAQWRGRPYEPRYRANEQVQITNEQEVMSQIADDISHIASKDLVIDTSGSFIYIDPSVISRLKQTLRFVYLRASTDQANKLFNDEVIFRRPLVWGDAYQASPSEDPLLAMKRCFPTLIEWRSQQYARWADLTLDAEPLSAPNFTPQQFLDLLY